MGHCWFTEMETCTDTLRVEREKGKKKELDSRKRILKAEVVSERGMDYFALPLAVDLTFSRWRTQQRCAPPTQFPGGTECPSCWKYHSFVPRP